MPGWVWRATAAPGSSSTEAVTVSYPAMGPSIRDRIARFRPGVVLPDCPSAAVATKPVRAQSAQPAKPRRVSMVVLPFCSKDHGEDGSLAQASVVVALASFARYMALAAYVDWCRRVSKE